MDLPSPTRTDVTDPADRSVTALSSILADAEGRMFAVIAQQRAWDEEADALQPPSEYAVDAYSPTGEFLAAGVVSDLWSYAQGDYVYGTRPDDNDETVVVRYRLTTVNGQLSLQRSADAPAPESGHVLHRATMRTPFVAPAPTTVQTIGFLLAAVVLASAACSSQAELEFADWTFDVPQGTPVHGYLVWTYFAYDPDRSTARQVAVHSTFAPPRRWASSLRRWASPPRRAGQWTSTGRTALTSPAAMCLPHGRPRCARGRS